MSENIAELSPLECATEITVAWLSNPNTRASAEDVPVFLQTMHSAVLKLNSGENPQEQEQAEPAVEYTPAVTVRKSLASPEHIISLIDGKPYRTLKRHLSANGLTPAQYRERYGLKANYPMVAPVYAETRRQLAKKIGLGRKPGQKSMKTSPVAVAAEPAAAAQPVVAGKSKPAAKPKAAGARKAAAKPAAPKVAAAPKAAAAAEPAAAAKPAAEAKPARRKKLGVQFGANGAAPADQS
jgi:predicted transcriptional regulator